VLRSCRCAVIDMNAFALPLRGNSRKFADNPVDMSLIHRSIVHFANAANAPIPHVVFVFELRAIRCTSSKREEQDGNSGVT